MLHLSIGEESAAVGVGEAMNTEMGLLLIIEVMEFSCQRCRPKKMMAEIGGKEDGYCRGKGGSMHIADNDLGHLGANAIVGEEFLMSLVQDYLINILEKIRLP